jgi:hypothetical protein
MLSLLILGVEAEIAHARKHFGFLARNNLGEHGGCWICVQSKGSWGHLDLASTVRHYSQPNVSSHPTNSQDCHAMHRVAPFVTHSLI